MHICVCGYGKYQNPKINRDGFLIYGCVCVYAWYSDTLKSYAARCTTYPQTRIWIPSFRRLGERCNANDVTNDSTRTECPRVTTHGQDRHSVTSYLRDRLMPAVVTARNTPGTHNNSATGPLSETGCAAVDNANGRHARY